MRFSAQDSHETIPCKPCFTLHHTAVLSRYNPRLFGIQLLFIPCHIDLRDGKSFVILAIPSLQCGLTLVVRCRNADRCKSRTTLDVLGCQASQANLLLRKKRPRFYMCTHKAHKMGFSVVPQGTYKYANRKKGPWVPNVTPESHMPSGRASQSQASLKPV